MDNVLRRYDDDGEATVGAWFIEGEWTCDTLEDQWRETKVVGDTRIPAGTYELKLKPAGTSRFDEAVQELLGDAHVGMIQLIGVPGFTQVLMHWGNFETDTAGCILVGTGVGKDRHGHHMVLKSKATYKAVYPRIADAILSGEKVTLTVIDGDRAE